MRGAAMKPVMLAAWVGAIPVAGSAVDAFCPDSLHAVFADMHDGDKKEVTISGTTMTIKPHGSDQSWLVTGKVDRADCSAMIDFNVEGKPSPPPVALKATLWQSTSAARKQVELEFTDPSGTLAAAGAPLNRWVEEASHSEEAGVSWTCPTSWQAVYADMHDGDRKEVTISGTSLTIVPSGNDQRWVVHSQVDSSSCSAVINFDVPNKPSPPPVSLLATFRQTLSASERKTELEFSDPSGTLASDAATLNAWVQVTASAKCSKAEAAFEKHQEASKLCPGTAAAPDPCFCEESGALLGLSYARLFACGLGSLADIEELKAATQACKVTHWGVLPLVKSSEIVSMVVAAPLELSAPFFGEQAGAPSATTCYIEAAFEKQQEAVKQCTGTIELPDPCFCKESGALLGLSYARVYGCGLGSEADIEEVKAATHACEVTKWGALNPTTTTTTPCKTDAAFEEHQEAVKQCTGTAAAPDPCFCKESGALLGLSYARMYGCGLGSEADIEEAKAAMHACEVTKWGSVPPVNSPENVSMVVAAPAVLSEALVLLFASVALVGCWISARPRSSQPPRLLLPLLQEGGEEGRL